MNLNLKDIVLAVTVGTAMVALTLLALPQQSQAHVVTRIDCANVAAVYPRDHRARVRTTCVRLAARHAAAHLCQRSDLTPFQAIDCIWPVRSRAAAKSVFDCESTAHVSNATARANGLGRWARNGQYWGIGQMGSNERATYGAYQIGSDARLQIKSALGLYRARGWSPWACA